MGTWYEVSAAIGGLVTALLPWPELLALASAGTIFGVVAIRHRLRGVR